MHYANVWAEVNLLLKQVENLSIIVNQHIIWYKLNRIRRLIKQILCNLDNQSLKIIRYAGIAIGATQMLVFTCYIFIFSNYYLKHISAKGQATLFNVKLPASNSISLITIHFVVFYVSELMTDWRILGVSLYVFVLVCNNRLNLKYFSQFESHLKQKASIDLQFVHSMQKMKILSNRTKAEFEDIFSIL